MKGAFGGGGPNGSRVLWPAGLERMTPAERAAALKRGWWRDGDWIITRTGQRWYQPEPQPDCVTEER